MCFENLYESSRRGELLLIEGGMCHWHLRRDGQLTIREIISTKPGAGNAMLEQLKETPGASCIVAKCPVDLASNQWYAKQGFELVNVESAKSGRRINVWKLCLKSHRESPLCLAQSSLFSY
jgi:hypothetical protein